MTIDAPLPVRIRRALLVGRVLTALSSVALMAGLGLRRWVQPSPWDRRSFAIATGLVLLGAVLWQWRLFFVRRSSAPGRSRRELRRHRWVGAFLMLLLFVHAGSMGVHLRSAIGLLLLSVVVSGLLRSDLFARARSAVGNTAWEWLHLGLAAVLLPLVLLHAWAAFAFRAPTAPF